MSQTEGDSSQSEVRIVRGKVDSLSLYEITEHELDTLEKGSPGSIHMNFGIFLTSIGLSFLTTLLSVDITSIRTFTVFVVLSAGGIALGCYFLLLWTKAQREVSNVVSRIKGRIATQTTEQSKR